MAEVIKQSVRFKTDEEKKLLEKVKLINSTKGVKFNDYIIDLIKKDIANTNIDDVIKEFENKLNS